MYLIRRNKEEEEEQEEETTLLAGSVASRVHRPLPVCASRVACVRISFTFCRTCHLLSHLLIPQRLCHMRLMGACFRAGHDGDAREADQHAHRREGGKHQEPEQGPTSLHSPPASALRLRSLRPASSACFLPFAFSAPASRSRSPSPCCGSRQETGNRHPRYTPVETAGNCNADGKDVFPMPNTEIHSWTKTSGCHLPPQTCLRPFQNSLSSPPASCGSICRPKPA